jgi:type I restriction enzyme S subunit
VTETNQLDRSGPQRVLKPYPAYKASGVEWLAKIPVHWDVKRLKFSAALNPPPMAVRRVPQGTEASFVPMEAVGEFGGLDLTRTRPVADIVSGYTCFEDGDVVIAKITPCFENGKGALAAGLANGVAFGTTELHVLRAGKAVDRRWLFYVTLSDAFRRLGEAEMYGAGGQKRVPAAFIENLKHPLPSEAEQRAIAAFLDRETARIDALVAKKERLIALLQEKRTALITRAVTKGLDPNVPMKDPGVKWLGEIPAHWEVRRIAMAAVKITNGYVGPTRDILVNEGVPYLQSLHIKNGSIDFERRPYFVLPSWSLEHRKSILEQADVLIVQTGDIGQVAVVPKEFERCNCHALIIVRLAEGVGVGEWLARALQSDYGQAALAWSQTGALHPHLECGHVREVRVPFPPKPEQPLILQALETALGRVDALTGQAREAIERLKELRTALISAAVTGKTDVREEGEVA